jgi:hypothetical protein
MHKTLCDCMFHGHFFEVLSVILREPGRGRWEEGAAEGGVGSG